MPVCGMIMVAKNGSQYPLLHVIFPIISAIILFLFYVVSMCMLILRVIIIQPL